MTSINPDSYIIVVVDCHGGEMPGILLDESQGRNYKISAGGECGSHITHDPEVKHTIYSTCAEYNSRDLSGYDASRALSARLKRSVLPNGELTQDRIASKCRTTSPTDVFKVSAPSYDKVFNFEGSKEWEIEFFGIYLVGMYNPSIFNAHGVFHNPPVNIKNEIFLRTIMVREEYRQKHYYPGHHAILLSILLTDLKHHYRVANVIIIDFSCRTTRIPELGAIGRTLSNPKRETGEPMETDQNPTRPICEYRCPFRCKPCDDRIAAQQCVLQGGNLLQKYKKNSKKRRSNNVKISRKRKNRKHM
jgi:hypothetical protein